MRPVFTSILLLAFGFALPLAARQTYTDGNAPKDLHVGNSTNGSLHLAAGGGALLILQGE